MHRHRGIDDEILSNLRYHLMSMFKHFEMHMKLALALGSRQAGRHASTALLQAAYRRRTLDDSY